eukprot:6049350-Pyramimonas_sp.AAC.1
MQQQTRLRNETVTLGQPCRTLCAPKDATAPECAGATAPTAPGRLRTHTRPRAHMTRASRLAAKATMWPKMRSSVPCQVASSQTLGKGEAPNSLPKGRDCLQLPLRTGVIGIALARLPRPSRAQGSSALPMSGCLAHG